MANPEHLAILKRGVGMWNEWREKNPEVFPNLDEVNLESAKMAGANLDHTSLRNAYLRYADFSGATLVWAEAERADLYGAQFVSANLHRANLKASQLEYTDFEKADLRKVILYDAKLHATNFIDASLSDAAFNSAKLEWTKLRCANLRGASFDHTFVLRADLRNTDLTNVTLDSAVFAEVDLSTVIGLETVRHKGPSTIGVDTIYRSAGNIPDVFLRGCGVPETFVTYARSLVGKPFDFYSCFISHSSKDKRFCERLHADLQANAVRVWYFPEDAKWGEPVWGEIDHSIKIYDKLIVVCSKNSLTSGPVLREIERALNREDEECKNVLFPITIDRYIFDKWEHPRKDDVLAKVVGTDFIGWNRDASKYDKALKKLLKALKAQ